ncbi:MAG: TonB-dependent receptor [Alphaproteobacteria bacterium]|nr:TonB-dependent receptor [Alphaproteobacteria bacterium]
MHRRSLALLLVACASPSLAQEPSGPTIVVTGRGLAPGTGEGVLDVVEVPRARLETAERLEDVLRDVPGFQLFRRSDASSANPTSQGATLRALGGNASSRALLLLDGVPQTDPFGGWVSWPAFDPYRLGSVRVTRGGGSGVEGPGALAGTIELESAGPDIARGVRAQALYGSRDSLEGRAAWGTLVGGGFASLSAAYARGDGFIPIVAEQRGPVDRPAPYEQASLAARAVFPVAPDVELQASGLGFTDRRERGTALSGIATTGADASLRLVGRRWSALAYVQSRDFFNSFASVNAARTAVARASEQYSVPSTGLGARAEWRPRVGKDVELRLGGDWRDTRGVSRELFSYVADAPTRIRAAGGRARTVGAFAEATWAGDRLTLTASGRLDRWDLSRGALVERTIATQALLTDAHYPDRGGWQPTGRAGLAWRPVPGLTLRSAAYAGWRLPTLNELYRPFRAGTDATAANPSLAPERLKGAEAGVDWRPLAHARLGLTLFANRLEDGIANVTMGKGPGNFPGVGFVAAGGVYRVRENIDAIVSRGVEIDGSVDRGPWRLSAGWSFADASVRASGAAAPLDRLRPAQTPRSTGSATLAWQGTRRAVLSVTGRYVSAQYEDDLNRQRLPGAFTLDAAARLPLARGVAVEARGENLANRRIYAGISGDGIVERATPRALWIGLSFSALP